MKQIFKYAMALLMVVAVASCGRDDASAGKEVVNSRGDYILSKDGTILVNWLNKEITSIDMERDPELKNVKVIGANAFENYQNLQQIILPNDLNKIGNSAFFSNSLYSIEFPNNIVSIGNYAFAINNFTSINIPNSVSSIGDYAFMDGKLTSIVIGNSVSAIGKEAFSVNKLISITVEAVNPPYLGRDAFSHNPHLTKIYVPAQSVNAYKQAEGWRQYAQYIQPKP